MFMDIRRQGDMTGRNSTEYFFYFYLSESRVQTTIMSDSLLLHGILQARILEWVAFPFSRGSSQPRDGTQVSYIAGRFFTSWATREAHFFFFFLNLSFYLKKKNSIKRECRQSK